MQRITNSPPKTGPHQGRRRLGAPSSPPGPPPGSTVLGLLWALIQTVREVRDASAPRYKTDYANATLIGDTEVIERVPDKKLQIVGYGLNNGGGSVATVHFRSGSRRISADKDLGADGGGIVTPVGLGFWFETAVGEALNINLLAAGAVGVDVVYVEVPGEVAR